MDEAPGRPNVIGWKEYITFPAWGLRRVRAKIDTGARTSALDVLSYQIQHEADKGLMVELRLALFRKHPERVKIVRTRVLQMVLVCNTGGTREERPLIETTVRIGNLTKPVRLTVTNRSGMRFPVILGRKALEGDFIVDVSQKYLLKKL